MLLWNKALVLSRGAAAGVNYCHLFPSCGGSFFIHMAFYYYFINLLLEMLSLMATAGPLLTAAAAEEEKLFAVD